MYFQYMDERSWCSEKHTHTRADLGTHCTYAHFDSCDKSLKHERQLTTDKEASMVDQIKVHI